MSSTPLSSDAPIRDVGDTVQSDRSYPPRARGLDSVVALLVREWQWLVIAAIYFLGWYFPFASHGRAGDGPLVWCWDEWGYIGNTLGFQLYVPVAFAVVVYARRQELQTFWRRRVVGRYPEGHPKREGNLSLLIFGCLLLFVSHLVEVKGVAVLALIAIAWGIVYRLYGPLMFRALLGPLLLLLLMYPPPDHFADSVLTVMVCNVIVKISALLLHGHSNGWMMQLPQYAVDIHPYSCGGANVVFATLLAVIAYLMARRTDPPRIVIALVLGTVIGVGLQIVRDVLAGVSYGSYPEISHWIVYNNLASWIEIVIASVATIFLASTARLPQRRARRSSSRAPQRGKSWVDALFIPFDAMSGSFATLGNLWKRSERGLERFIQSLLRKKRKRPRRRR